MDYEEPTQLTQNTQGALDPRRIGRNNSGLTEADISDVICILHPCSPAAFKIVATTAERSPHNVLQNDGFDHFNDGLTQSALEEQETFILGADAPHQAMDLALRFSTRTVNPQTGFIFGRNSDMCDIVMATDTFKRVSNIHFSIFINDSGVLMLMDMSTNGTIIDDIVLKGKNTRVPQTRMLNPGSIIQILSPKSEEIVEFIVRIPSREGHIAEYEAKFGAYMDRVAADKATQTKHNMLTRRAAAANPVTQIGGSIRAPLITNQYGMHWSGGEKYNVVGLIGKGAFATVYQLATKSEGQLFAAKELEKRKFMKNGVLDRKLDNEMQIMKSVSHSNIVQYVDYQDHANHMYIIMEFVPCGDLQKYLGLHGPLSEDLARTMASQVFDALAYLHSKRITHRDIKPDNILIANLEAHNFTVKLSDFGLSKVVTDNETFLKTFCGTLLWCAPEVFPHYDAHMAGKGKKRPRQSKNLPATKFHSYSSTVDIWSFGGVLWYSLCHQPPFEGVADGNGRGMFDKIMVTPLDPTDLLKKGVSDVAVDLLTDMLNTDPAARPSPAQCLRHAWIGVTQPDSVTSAEKEGLISIAEEDEGVEGEPDVSGLSLDEFDSNAASQTSEVSIHSASFEFLDPRQSKRFKSDMNMYRDPDEMIDSSPELFYQSIPIMHQPDAASGASKPQPPKLFGEISQSLLRSSALLGHAAVLAGGNGSSSSSEWQQDEDAGTASKGAVASPSLLGAESMVRELNMDSPHGPSPQDRHDHEPVEPVTPSRNRKSASLNHIEEITPKQATKPAFDRRINIPLPASSYYIAEDPSTHNLEYATKVSGYDYVKESSFNSRVEEHEQVTGSNTTANTENEALHEDAEDPPAVVVQADSPHNFLKPPPRLGKLTSTSDSFEPIVLHLTTRRSTWGRDPANTHVYPNKYDIRIPKLAFTIWFWAKRINDIPEEDQDTWLKTPDLHCVISTNATAGIQVNGVTMKRGEAGRTTFGRLYTGDEITVLQKGVNGEPGLRFVCEFNHGQAVGKRPTDKMPFHIEVTSQKTSSTPGSSSGKSEMPAKKNGTAISVA
jgi:serine/threonine protein kinase